MKMLKEKEVGEIKVYYERIIDEMKRNLSNDREFV
jgi:hypothetical protein